MERCEDYPACGHEAGDCQGQKYGTDAAIMERERQRIESGYYDYYDY